MGLGGGYAYLGDDGDDDGDGSGDNPEMTTPSYRPRKRHYR